MLVATLVRRQSGTAALGGLWTGTVEPAPGLVLDRVA